MRFNLSKIFQNFSWNWKKEVGRNFKVEPDEVPPELSDSYTAEVRRTHHVIVSEEIPIDLKKLKSVLTVAKISFILVKPTELNYAVQVWKSKTNLEKTLIVFGCQFEGSNIESFWVESPLLTSNSTERFESVMQTILNLYAQKVVSNLTLQTLLQLQD